jgi:hypothetical protein
VTRHSGWTQRRASRWKRPSATTAPTRAGPCTRSTRGPNTCTSCSRGPPSPAACWVSSRRGLRDVSARPRSSTQTDAPGPSAAASSRWTRPMPWPGPATTSSNSKAPLSHDARRTRPRWALDSRLVARGPRGPRGPRGSWLVALGQPGAPATGRPAPQRCTSLQQPRTSPRNPGLPKGGPRRRTRRPVAAAPGCPDLVGRRAPCQRADHVGARGARSLPLPAVLTLLVGGRLAKGRTTSAHEAPGRCRSRLS